MNKNLIIISVIILIIAVMAVIYFSLPKQNTATKMQPQTNQNQQVSTTATSFDIQGMTVDILKQGTGDGAKAGDNIVVNYVGTLTDGTKFDSSIDRNQPFPYTLGTGQVIKGWELGLLGMKDGEERKLTIPPELAYGSQSPSPLIPANSILIFDITMLSINGK
jgi:peptidylprolyl isomerase/FKBP-type peptidyl-prolyl cis-trans isomerase FkpA